MERRVLEVGGYSICPGLLCGMSARNARGTRAGVAGSGLGEAPVRVGVSVPPEGGALSGMAGSVCEGLATGPGCCIGGKGRDTAGPLGLECCPR